MYQIALALFKAPLLLILSSFTFLTTVITFLAQLYMCGETQCRMFLSLSSMSASSRLQQKDFMTQQQISRDMRMTPVMAAITTATMKMGSDHILQSANWETSQFLMVYPRMRQRTLMSSWQQTTISMRVMLVVGGRDSLITGTRPTQTIIRVAMLPILSLQSGPWTKVKRVRMVMRTSGMKMVRESMMGYLQKGMLKVITLNERQESALSLNASSVLNFSHFTESPVSARSYSPKLPSSVNISCSNILFFSSEESLPTLFMQLNLNFTNSEDFLSALCSSTSTSSKMRLSLKLRRLKGAIRSQKMVPGARLISNYFLMVHLIWKPSSCLSASKEICPSKIRFVGNLSGLSLLNCTKRQFLLKLASKSSSFLSSFTSFESAFLSYLKLKRFCSASRTSPSSRLSLLGEKRS